MATIPPITVEWKAWACGCKWFGIAFGRIYKPIRKWIVYVALFGRQYRIW